MNPSAVRLDAVRGELVGLAGGDGHVGLDTLLAAARAQELGERLAGPACGEVVERDVHRRLRAEVGHHRLADLARQVVEVVDVATAHDVGQRTAQAGLRPGQRLARHPPDLRRLAVPAGAVVGDHLDDRGLEVLGAAQRRDERRVQGRRQPLAADLRDLHRSPA